MIRAPAPTPLRPGERMRARWRIEIFVPVADGRAGLYDLREDLAARFGGVTAFERAPATGLWREDGQEGGQESGQESGQAASAPARAQIVREPVVILETMADDFDPNWWRAFREGWEARLGQRQLLVRASRVMEV
jgi:hypothetical protein